MKIQYDNKADSAYISLKDIGVGEVAHTYPCNPLEVKGMINLDFDKGEKLIGIEIIDASKKLPKDILDSAELIGR